MIAERLPPWIQLLQYLSQRLGDVRPPLELRSLARESLLNQSDDNTPLTLTEAFVLLEQITHRLDWRLQRMVYAPEELVRLPPQSFPLFTYLEDSDAPWLCIDTVEGGRLRVVLPNADTEEAFEWWTARELTAFLGAATPKTPSSWVLLETAMPLESMQQRHSDLPPEQKAYQRFRSLVFHEKTDILVVLSYSLVIGLLSLTTPVVVQALVNTVAFGTLLQPLVVLSLLLAAGLSFSAILQSLRTVVVEVLLRRIFVKVCLDFAYRLPRVCHAPFQQKGGAELVNRFFDVIKVQKTFSVLLFDGISAVLQISVGLLLLAMYHPVLLALDLLLIAFLLFVMRVLGRNAVVTSIQESKLKYKVAAWLEEIARNPMTFKAFGAPSYAVEHAEHLAQEYVQTRHKHFKILFRQIVGAFSLQVLASVSLLLVGGWLVLQRQLTLGQLVAAELVLATMLASISKLGKIFENYYDLMASLDKLGQVFDLPLETSHGDVLPHQRTGIEVEVKNLHYRYEHAEAPLFNNLSFSLKPGEKVALWGRAGAGKSSLLELLFGLRTPQKGQISLDHHEMRELNLESLRREVVALHHVEILEGSILDNIIMGRSNLSRKDAREALRQVGLLNDILSLPRQLDTMLTAQGMQFSRTQRARLVLARAIVGEPRMLMLDSFLDELTEDVRPEFISLLTSDNAPWTLLLVSQDPEWWDACDRVLLLSQGRVREASLSRDNDSEVH
jgi:ABC-type bacteriocin/lantibiotic exporter with double-glycine peptidase domain